MRLRRKIVTVIVSVACGLALAACGQQVVAKVKAGDSVKTALTGVFNSSTTRLDITAQDLPGIASLADGSFSIVITTSRNPGTSASTQDESAELSIYHGSEPVKPAETRSFHEICAGSFDTGLLIHAAWGRSGGIGGLLTNRSGWAA